MILDAILNLQRGDLRDMMMTRDSDADIAFVRPGKEDSYTAKNILRRCLMKE